MRKKNCYDFGFQALVEYVFHDSMTIYTIVKVYTILLEIRGFNF